SSTGDLDGDTVGDSLAGYPSPTAREEQGVRHLGRAIAVLQAGVPVLLHDLRLDPLESLPEVFERLHRLLIRRPFRRVPLSQVHLVRRVVRQDLDGVETQNREQLAGDGLQEHLVRVRLQLLVLRRARLRHEAPAHGRPVRQVPGVGVLPEVDGGVERRTDPDDGGACLDQLGCGVHVRPPVLVLFVAMADLADLLPPGLELGISFHDVVRRVVDCTVLSDPCLDRMPYLKSVHGIRVILDQ
ncbi:hypothetical protein BHE74_00039371, partial [Ensete ventricosum]